MHLSEPLQRWYRRGQLERVRGLDVFFVREGRGAPLLLLHGFPTSGYDWSAALPQLTAQHTVLVPDLPGYGLSAKPALYSYSLIDQAELLIELLEKQGIEELHLVAHDMGTSVACELLQRRAQQTLPFTIRSLTLTNGSVYQDMAHLTPTQRILARPLLGRMFTKVANRAVFKLQLRGLFGKRDALPDDELDRIWELMERNQGIARMPALASYMAERRANTERWHTPLRALDIPAMVLWGNRDPVAVFAIAERLHREIPGALLVTLDGLGHFPMLEDPARVADAILSFTARAAPLARASVAPPPLDDEPK